MCCGNALAGAGSASGAGDVTAAVEVDGPAGGCKLVPWLLAWVRQVPMMAAMSGELRVVHGLTIE
jgi:hypothetical protein